MKINSLENKSIAILGFGVTGREVYEVLKDDYDVTIINDSVLDLDNAYTYDQFKAAGKAVDIIIKSPGVPYSHQMLVDNKHAFVTNDIELSYEVAQSRNVKIVAITGTNGKTTTTHFINEVLVNKGCNSFSCGNIGNSPLYVLANNDNVSHLVMELSSYQLKQVDQFHPNYGLFLNVTPDHIDYHGDFADYANSKANLYKHMTEDDVLVVSKQVKEHLVVPEFALTEAKEDELTAITTVSMPKQNYSLIYQLLINMGLDKSYIIEQINKFSGLEHRMELIKSNNPFTVINDSKATNVQATNVAISNVNRPTVLIVGGSEKVEDYTKLDYQNGNIKQVISYGDTRSKFDFIPNLIKYEKFADAVIEAMSLTNENEILLLSPACASFDQHQNYGERGLEFKRLVKERNE